MIEQNRVVYGINTGFGLLANTRIPVEQLDELQRSIVLSHAAGIGEYMDDATVRLMMVLKLNSLARGFSGIRQVVLEALMRLINAEVYPVVPKKGSVGASGDLAPLAHMSCLLIGEGKARHAGELMDAATALKIAGLEPIALAPKEGLALLNGTQASTAFALEGLFHAEDLYAGAITIGAMSVEAALAAAARSMPASMRCAVSVARSTRPPATATCWWMAARSACPITTARRCRIPTPALPAAGDGRLPDPDPPGSRGAGVRGQRGLRQPAGVCRG